MEFGFKTTVHQTLEDRNNPDHIEQNGPFPVNNPEKAYLGNGYYFWDDHINLAHWWGMVHNNNNYIICESELTVNKELFFDLVGSRQDMMHLKEMIIKLKLNHLTIGTIIEILKEIDFKSKEKGIFPFKVIRAVDVSKSNYKQEWYKFSPVKKGTTNLTPMYIICIIEKCHLFLSSYKIIYPECYVQ